MIGNNLAKLSGVLLLALRISTATIQAQLAPPPDPNAPLNVWNFNTTFFETQVGPELPLSATNVSDPVGFDGNALRIDSTNTAWIKYHIHETDGTTNLTFPTGSIELWISPDWTNGAGPNDWGRMIEVGNYSMGSPSDWWSFYFDPTGTNIYFSSETNGIYTNYFSYPISWTTGAWHHVALTYGPGGSSLYLNGQLATNGAGVSYSPSTRSYTNGFIIGSDSTGTNQARALIDDFATYSYARSSGQILGDYNNGLAIMSDTNSGGSLTVNYGTNLWIAQVNISSNLLQGFASNTLADVPYEIQWVTNLASTNWTSLGLVYGSEVTNWTALNAISVSLENNLFIRLRSWYSSDGSGLPDWWELQYFGHTGIDPNADPAGDGWSNIQKFQNGMNPNQFYTPAAPQGVTLTFNGTNLTATIHWIPSLGNVTNYIVSLKYPWGTTITNLSVGPGTDSVVIDVSQYTQAALETGTPDIDVAASVQAQYSGGNSTASRINGPSRRWYTPISLVSDTQGNPYFAIANVPPDTTGIRIFRYDQYAESFEGDDTYDTNFDVSLSGLTNGLVPISASDLSTPADGYGAADYEWYEEPINGSGGQTAESMEIGYTLGTNGLNAWLVEPSFDGRVELKENLRFLLRAGNNTQFYFIEADSGGQVAIVTNPVNYAYASFYQDSAYTTSDPIHGTYTSHSPYLDPSRPFADNSLYENFVYNPNNLAANGRLTNGIGGSYEFEETPNGSLYLTVPPPYQLQFPITSGTPSHLSTNDTTWLASYPLDSAPQDIGAIGMLYSEAGSMNNYFFPTGGRNWFGLPYLSAKIASSPTSITTLDAGGATVTTPLIEQDYFYSEVAQPQFQTVEYDFWNAETYPEYDTYGTVLAETMPLPGVPGFDITNESQLLITGLGQSIQVAGYAKLAVTNSYSTDIYGYLGQYFENAFVISNGITTTNLGGLLSPYGTFFPTIPGQAALVTMADVESGMQGTGVVNTISLQLDKNHDGAMDLSFSGPDSTSQFSPYVFWCNNNYDRWAFDSSDNVSYEDDLSPQAVSGEAVGDQVPDCQYGENFGTRIIPTTRDLEDFSRLWVCGITTNLLASLPSGSTVTLDWGDVGSPNPTNPAIDLFVASDSDGGIGYLTNSVIASNQIDWTRSPYLGRISPGTSIQLNNYLGTNWFGNYFIWCGATNGTGQLNLSIKDSNGIVLAQSSAWIRIKDIKQMYERWTVGDDASTQPATNAVLASNDLLTSPIAKPFEYDAPPDPFTPYILYVHGWNMTPWDKDRFAETAFKRLFWQGYQGRFGSFRWPTDNGFNGTLLQLASSPSEKDNYDRSEYQAWLSAQGLLNKLQDLNAKYNGNIYLLAHSMGNVVAGEALRLSGTNQVVKTYVASQAALSAHEYDTNVPNYSFYFPPYSAAAATPNIYGNWFVGNNGGGAGQVVNFYNTNDFALQRSAWQLNQLFKPDQLIRIDDVNWDYGYRGSASDASPWNNFYKQYSTLGIVNFDIVNVLTNRYEVMGFAAQSWTTAFGATPDVHNISDAVYLGQVWAPDAVHPSNPFDEHFYHSAEFRGANWFQYRYWKELLGSDGFDLQ